MYYIVNYMMIKIAYKLKCKNRKEVNEQTKLKIAK